MKYLRLFETEAEYSAATLDYPNISYIEATDRVSMLKEEPLPPLDFCYDVTENIGTYTSTTYDEVYDKASSNWYMLNNLNQYEQYGVYGNNKTTYYDGKLVVVDNHEWKYTNGAWVDLGEVSGGETSYEFPDYGTMVGTSFPTTFKIAKSYCCGEYTYFNIGFNSQNGNFSFNYSNYGSPSVMCSYNDTIQGIEAQLPYTEDEDYYYFAPDEYTEGVPDSIVVESANGESDCQTPFYVIGEGEISYIEEYTEKAAPAKILTFTSITEANAYSGCVYNGEYAKIGESIYKLTDGRWKLQPYPPYKAILTLNGGTIVNIPFDGDRTLYSSETTAYTSATSVEITNAVTSIGDNSFQLFSYLTNITIPNSVETIGMQCVVQCSSLTSITIPDSVTSIGYASFGNNSGITSIHIGSGLTSIGNNVFLNSTNSLTSITVDENNITYDSRNDCNAIIITSTNKLKIGCANTIIPDSVTSIASFAFANSTSLTNVTIPNSVTSIEDAAFSSCTSLSSVTIGSGVTNIGNNAFFNAIGSSSLESIISLATTAPTIGARTFFGAKTNGTLYVPTGSSGYDTWMQNVNYYLGKYNWTKVEQ